MQTSWAWGSLDSIVYCDTSLVTGTDQLIVGCQAIQGHPGARKPGGRGSGGRGQGTRVAGDPGDPCLGDKDRGSIQETGDQGGSY